MMKRPFHQTILPLATAITGFFILWGCEKEVPTVELPPDSAPVPLFLDIPEGFPDPFFPLDNPLTEEGVALGRKLFYDPIMSRDGSISCGSCHHLSEGFAHQDIKLSPGVDGLVGTRNTMALVNPGWQIGFFWDGRSLSLAHQALEPIENPVEMDMDWPTVVDRLQSHPEYPALFNKVFGTADFDESHVTKAIEQFELTMISGNSRYDQAYRFEIVLTEQERRGQTIFFTEKGDCFHCHGQYPLLADNEMHNNGLDLWYADGGLETITGDPQDNGKFRTPSLRNIALTAPYMHDGRLETLEDVIDHYSSGLNPHPNIDPLFKQINQGGVQLSPMEKADLLAFLQTFTDPTFLNNEALSDPNQE